MEWMLQVVDELDDAVGVLGLYALGARLEIGIVFAGGIGIGAALLGAG